MEIRQFGFHGGSKKSIVNADVRLPPASRYMAAGGRRVAFEWSQKQSDDTERDPYSYDLNLPDLGRLTSIRFSRCSHSVSQLSGLGGSCVGHERWCSRFLHDIVTK